MKKFSMRGASWDSMFLTFVKILTTLSSIILTKLLSEGLSLEQYGTYSQANIFVGMGTSAILLGFGDAINYFYNTTTLEVEKNTRLRIVNTIFFLEIMAGIALATTAILGRGLLAAYFSNDALKILILVVAFKPMLDNMVYFYQLLYVSTGKAKVIAIRNLVVMALKITAMYVAVYVLKDLVWIFTALITLDILQLIFFKILLGKQEFWVNPFKILPRYIGKILAYSLPMGIYALTSALSRELDKLVVGRLMDTETLAVYTNCSKILPFDIIVVSFATVLIPYIMRYVSGSQKEDAAKLFSNYLKVGYYSVWVFGVAVLITSEQVIEMLYSPEYVSGNPVFIVYVLDSMVKFASMHLILTAGGKSKKIMTYSLITLGMNLVLNVVLYYLLGMIGPAVATLVTTLWYTIQILNSSMKLIGVKWREVFDWKDVLTFILGLVITGVIFFLTNRLLLGWNVNQFVAMLISAGGFCSVNLIINWKRISGALRQLNSLRVS